MNESILTSTKKMLGITEEYEHFDADIIIHINSVFSILQQLGVGDPAGYMIYDKTSKWNDFIVSEDPRLNMVKTYMYQKVRMMFDPPQAGSLKEALQNSINELEWRINIQVDPPNSENTGHDEVCATDEEVQDMIEDLDSLGKTGHHGTPTASDKEVDDLIHNLDDLDPCEDLSDSEVKELIDDLDNLGEQDISASQEDIVDLVNHLENL